MRIVNLMCVAFLAVGCGRTTDAGSATPDAGGQGDNPGGTGGNGDTGNGDMGISGGGNNGGGGGGTTGGGFKFAVFGDCRPPNVDDTSGYPSAVVSGIFKLAQDSGAQFAVGTGDYMFASQATAVTAQVALFSQAKATFTAGPVYLAMGNHECTGYTDSNCPNLNETPNVQAFMKLVPSGVTRPYYRVDFTAAHGKAKLVVIAANAWDTTQQTWLQTQLADPTTYTFVVRHEPSTSPGVPTGVTASESIVTAHPYTLELLGHTHEYRRADAQHVISGNAGAPLSSGNYGLLLIEEGANGNVTVSEVDEATGHVTDTWSVTATGQKI